MHQMRVIEHHGRGAETETVLPDVAPVLRLVPFESSLPHRIDVCMYSIETENTFG
jgi:hypothetical protein